MWKQITLAKTLHKMLKQGLTSQIMNQKEQCLKKKNIKKAIGLMKDELGGANEKKIAGLKKIVGQSNNMELFNRKQR